MTARRYRFRAISADGVALSASLIAHSRAEAHERLTKDRKIVLELAEAEADVSGNRKPSRREAGMALRQIAVMIGAGVELLEALEIIAASLPGQPISEAMRATAVSLRQGDRLAAALRVGAPFYSEYVYALVRAGEASGRLPLVLEEAARHMAFEDRVSRDIQNALFYPAFLVLSGFASMAFLFYSVVPRFAQMLTGARAELTGLSAFVINTGVFVHDHAAVIAISIVVAILAIIGFANTKGGRAFYAAISHSTPGLRQFLHARERVSWSRIMALALESGVDVLEATSIAANAATEGPIRRGAMNAIVALRAGRPVDEAFRNAHALTQLDASLVRAGQRSGAMSQMFRVVADRNEEEMRDALRRFTSILEPVAIAIVAGMIGVIVLGLVSALAGIYDSIG